MAGAEIAPSGSRRSSWLSAAVGDLVDDDPFRRSQASRGDDGDDEENLRWAALEKLPTYDRMRRGIIRRALDNTSKAPFSCQKILHSNCHIESCGTCMEH